MFKPGQTCIIQRKHSNTSRHYHGMEGVIEKSKLAVYHENDRLGKDPDFKYTVEVKFNHLPYTEMFWGCEIKIKNNPPSSDFEWLDRVKENFKEGV